MEERLYYQDSTCRLFDAKILKVEPAEGGRFDVELSQTAFFPEGGGQPCDRGVICDGSALFSVVNVQERNGRVFHTVEGKPVCGEDVRCEIEWDRRFDFSQQHSGEHMLSGVLHRMTGGDNVGFHLSEDTVTLDFSVPITQNELRAAETEVNRAIWKNLSIDCRFYPAPVPSYIEYRSKKEIKGELRLVSIPGIDVCACCGTHVKNTGEIGLVKILDSMSYKGGTRIWMAAGKRAFQFFSALLDGTAGYASKLSAKTEDGPAAVQKLIQDYEEAKLEITSLKKFLLAQRVKEKQSVTGDIIEFVSDMHPDELRRYALALSETRIDCCAVFAGNDATGYRYAIAKRDTDMRAWCKEMNRLCNGRGGGNTGLVQGTLQSDEISIRNYIRINRI